MTRLFSSPSPASRPQSVKFAPVVNLMTGEAITTVAHPFKRYEERAAFGPAAANRNESQLSAGRWLAAHIRDVIQTTEDDDVCRPVIVSAPLTAMADPATVPECDAIISQSNMCHQEISIEVSDAAVSSETTIARAPIEALVRRGFRISLNATRTWEANLANGLHLMLDSVRIDGRALDRSPEIYDLIEAASDHNIPIIAEHVHWRDGDYLARLGIEFAINPKTDS